MADKDSLGNSLSTGLRTACLSVHMTRGAYDKTLTEGVPYKMELRTYLLTQTHVARYKNTLCYKSTRVDKCILNSQA